MTTNDIYTVDDLVDNLRECAKDWLYCGGSEALEEQFELASEAIRERVTDFEAKVIALQKELAALKAELAKYEWQSGHPDDDRDVWVCWNDGLGGKMYESGWYDKNWFDENSMPCNDDAVHAWSEIRPWKGE